MHTARFPSLAAIKLRRYKRLSYLTKHLADNTVLESHAQEIVKFSLRDITKKKAAKLHSQPVNQCGILNSFRMSVLSDALNGNGRQEAYAR